MSSENRFTIRVYGLLCQQGHILLSREKIQGQAYLKFPGGGLEYGEGTRACLRREFQEEAGVEVEVGNHFYTTDVFVRSAFHRSLQVISIYYFVSSPNLNQINTGTAKDDPLLAQSGQVLFWQALSSLQEEDFPLPIDQRVVRQLKEDPDFPFANGNLNNG